MSSPEITKKRNSRPNRLGIGFLSIIQIILAFLALLFINYLSSHNSFRKDLSRSADYSLSGSTKNYLRSSPITSRERPVKWIIIFRRESPIYERVRALAEEYERVSKGRVEIEIVDPMPNLDRANQVIAAYNLTLVRDLILIDARPNENDPIITKAENGSPALNPHITITLVEEMLAYTTDVKGQRRPDSFRGEEMLTAKLVAAIEGKPRTFLFLADKSRVDSAGENSPWENLAKTLAYQNILLQPANLAGLSSIPPEINGLALVAPKYDFTDEEIATLDAYWNTPRSAILILLEPGECPPKLRTFLRSKGITPRRDRIISKDSSRIITTAQGNFTQGIPFLKDLAGQDTVFEGESSSMEVRESNDELATRKILPVPLIRVRNGFWGEVDFGKPAAESKPGENFDAMRDNSAPLYIAAAVTRGDDNDDKLAAETSRMIVLSTIDFLQPNRQRADNIDFLASASNWLVDRDALTGTSPRPIGIYILPLLDAQVSFINRLNLIFAPIAFVLIGGVIFSTRRA